MIWTVKLTVSGGMYIPKTMKDATGIMPGDYVVYEILKVSNTTPEVKLVNVGVARKVGTSSVGVWVDRYTRDFFNLSGGDLITIDVKEVLRGYGKDKKVVWRDVNGK